MPLLPCPWLDYSFRVDEVGVLTSDEEVLKYAENEHSRSKASSKHLWTKNDEEKQYQANEHFRHTNSSTGQNYLHILSKSTIRDEVEDRDAHTQA